MVRAIERVREGWLDAGLADAARLALFCGLFWAAKALGERVTHVPGHAVALWVPVLIVAQCVIRRPGSAALVALGGAGLAALPSPGPASLAGHVAGGLVIAALGPGTR